MQISYGKESWYTGAKNFTKSDEAAFRQWGPLFAFVRLAGKGCAVWKREMKKSG